jgi:carbonic anhydrase
MTSEILSLYVPGGRVRQNIRDVASLDILLKMDDIMVVHHIGCGLTNVTDEKIRGVLGERGGYVGDSESYGCMTDETLAGTCREGVRFLKEHPWVRGEIRVHGFVLIV